MGQMGFYDLANRYAGLDAKADPLVKLKAMVPWDDFRARLDTPSFVMADSPLRCPIDC